MKAKFKTTDQVIDTQADKGRKHIPFSLIHEEYEIGILRIKDIIDKTTNSIFTSYKKKLLSEPITYIVPAVWGKIKHGKLTACQREINEKITPMISSIMEIFELEEINGAQRFAIEYLIRGLATSKITYLIESFKNQQKTKTGSEEKNPALLDNLDTFGNA